MGRLVVAVGNSAMVLNARLQDLMVIVDVDADAVVVRAVDVVEAVVLDLTDVETVNLIDGVAISKTGVKAVDKREGSGSYNWGSDKELVEENLNAEVSDHDTSAENPEKIEEGAAPVEGEETKTEEEQAREMTLDEYKAQQKAAKANLKPAFNIRKAGEGENQAQWKKTYVLK